MSDALLSTLCSICHVRPQKYRCPRCSTLTCSLSCVKCHKQRAQCNGVRDPSVYIRQKDLATPKGIDHDYNYLTSLEREIDVAERCATSRGVILQHGGKPNRHSRKTWKEYELMKALQRCGVVIVRAPKGMSRSKQNSTHLSHKTRTIIWSVEWIHPDGTSEITDCRNDKAISEAYTANFGSKSSLAFYLHHPSLPSSKPVLISCPPDAALSIMLTNRLILEFPTIYVVEQQPGNKLPENLITEADFFDQAGKGLVEELEEGELLDEESIPESNERETEEGQLDEKRLLEVLGKDLGGVSGLM